jgi:hypothetical protein
VVIEKPIRDVVLEDLQRLVTNRVAESRVIEYKQALPGNSDGDKKEFLGDVSAFANAAGGDILYGVTEVRENNKPTGVPESIDGLAGVNTDAEMRRLDNMLRDGVQPRIQGLQYQWVEGAPSGSVLVIRVPRSWAGPHMVVFQQLGRFYARNAAGKYPLDVIELRQAFLGSGSVAERAREFRAERVGRLLAGESAMPLEGNRLVCLHFIPHTALVGGNDIDIQKAANAHDYVRPLYVDYNHTHTFNLDGVLTYHPTSAGSTYAYLQVYRSGILETATTGLVSESHSHGLSVPSLSVAQQFAGFLDRSRRLMQQLDVNPPASLFVSMLNVRGATLGIDQRLSFRRDIYARPFDRDHLMMREVTLLDWDGSAFDLLKPILNGLWQAAGLPRCFDYNDAGEWKPRR